MTVDIPRPAVKGSKALVAGVANAQGIASGRAKAFRELAAEPPH